MQAAKEKLADPVFASWFHGWASIVWFVASFPICIFLNTSLPLIVFVSVYAIVVSHWAAWQAAQVEKRQIKHENGSA